MEILERALPIVTSMGAEDKSEHSKILFKYYLKKAALLKRGSCFRESYDTLLDLEAQIRLHLKPLGKGTTEHRVATSALFKTIREQARVNSLLKDYTVESRCEQESW